MSSSEIAATLAFTSCSTRLVTEIPRLTARTVDIRARYDRSLDFRELLRIATNGTRGSAIQPSLPEKNTRFSWPLRKDPHDRSTVITRGILNSAPLHRGASGVYRHRHTRSYCATAKAESSFCCGILGFFTRRFRAMKSAEILEKKEMKTKINRHRLTVFVKPRLGI
jgi:hypothetical protein